MSGDGCVFGMIINVVCLITCVVATVVRVPTAIRTKRWGAFGAFALLTVAVALTLPVVYYPVDWVLGEQNIANLILRFVLNGAFLLIGVSLVYVYGSVGARQYLLGWKGLVVAGGVVVALIISFAGLPRLGSSVSLNAYVDDPFMQLYASVGRIYPGYVAAVVLVPILRAVFARVYTSWMRVASALMWVGLGGTVLSAVLQFWITLVGETPVSAVMLTWVTYLSIIAFLTGVLLIAVMRRRDKAGGVQVASPRNA